MRLEDRVEDVDGGRVVVETSVDSEDCTSDETLSSIEVPAGLDDLVSTLDDTLELEEVLENGEASCGGSFSVVDTGWNTVRLEFV